MTATDIFLPHEQRFGAQEGVRARWRPAGKSADGEAIVEGGIRRRRQLVGFPEPERHAGACVRAAVVKRVTAAEAGFRGGLVEPREFAGKK